eukprot:CAMPEP_0113609696 /NCGR_PEP_ID=MMETSP0017_2-20120614/4632_1 /TAXON_ID=2856 /ORGANISM="Cylindrotheca closterium" /LENGTH=246 /DNA_ID=CAMNT_0000518537 /DNA_START=380 /DNA_END=1120 /DNA_ORIENTATION=- /assembly_acc=CAM_ASM_000147
MASPFASMRKLIVDEFEIQKSVLTEDLLVWKHGCSKKELEFREQIRGFEEDLLSNAFLTKLNTTIAHRMSSCKESTEYYESNPDLKEYTLEKELDRIPYTVITTDGKRQLTKSDEIREYVATETKEEEEKHSILYRAANQSIFADVIVALTCSDGLVRPQLHAGTFVDKCSITVDLSKKDPHVRATCFVNVSIPDAEGHRLSMASVLVSIFYCPCKEQLRSGIMHLLPHKRLTDEEVAGAARSLAH